MWLVPNSDIYDNWVKEVGFEWFEIDENENILFFSEKSLIPLSWVEFSLTPYIYPLISLNSKWCLMLSKHLTSQIKNNNSRLMEILNNFLSNEKDIESTNKELRKHYENIA